MKVVQVINTNSFIVNNINVAAAELLVIALGIEVFLVLGGRNQLRTKFSFVILEFKTILQIRNITTKVRSAMEMRRVQCRFPSRLPIC